MFAMALSAQANTVQTDLSVCGGPWSEPCSETGVCMPGTIEYSTIGRCVPCGGDEELCCGMQDDSACSSASPGSSCKIGKDPLVSSSSEIYGLAMICTATEDTAGISDQSGETSEPRRVEKDSGRMQWRDSPAPDQDAAQHWPFELDTLFGMSMFFLEVQRSGRLPESTRPPWRGDSFNSGGNWFGGVDGGYFDAGDHCIFQLPHAYTIARVAWAAHAFWGGLATSYFDGASNYDWAYDAVRWGADFLAANVEEDRTLLHVGDIDADHAYIGRSELYPEMDRNVRWCEFAQCSDVTGEVASALAHAAVVFKEDAEKRDHYWSKAQLAYAQTGVGADTFGNSNDAYDKLAVFYASSGVVSHVLFGAASMYTACVALECGNEAAYLEDVMRLGNMEEPDGQQKWFWPIPSWDHAWFDAAALMLSHGVTGPDVYGQPAFLKYLGELVSTWVDAKEPVQASPRGQRWVSAWGSNRFALNGAAMLLLWSNLPDDLRSGGASQQAARCAAVKQIHYVAGDNDMGAAYIVGFGDDPPGRNHHRNSACLPEEQNPDPVIGCSKVFVDVVDPLGACPAETEDEGAGVCYVDANRRNPLQAHGALIGGPKTPSDAGDSSRRPYSDQGWNDWRTDFIGNEQATDYNALYTLALAAAMELPSEFWSEGCGSGIDALPTQSGRGAGDRIAETYSDSDVWTFADFEAYGWTRSKE